MQGSSASGRDPQMLFFWSLITFVAGAGTMMLELTAPRLMQPYFGASVFVWTNVIGVLLLALAVGYGLGGRLASRSQPARRIGWTLIASGVWSMAIPFVFPTFALWLLPAPSDLTADGDGRGLLQLASLTTTAILLAPAVVALATASPQIVSVLHSSGEAVGKAASRVFMMGTLGSLVGTFLPTYLLIPTFGTRVTLIASGTFFVLGGILAVAGGLNGRFLKGAAPSLLVAALALMLSGRQPLRAALEGEELLFEDETSYQYIRLVRAPAEGPDLEGEKEVFLRIDEGVLEYHSVAPTLDGDSRSAPRFLGSGGKYYDSFALLPLAFPAKRQLSVAVLGSGAGTMARVLNLFMGHRIASLVNVELDPGVAALESRLGWDNETAAFRSRTIISDGRTFVRLSPGPFDLIFVDAYARGTEIPPQMATIEFFTDIRRLLSPDGIVALNVSTWDVDGGLFQSLVRTMSEAGLSGCWSSPIEGFPNVMLMARRNGQPLGLPEVSDALHSELRRPLKIMKRWLAPAKHGADAQLLTDDLAPLGKLADLTLGGGKDR